MGGADSRDIIDLGPGLLSRLGASIRARGAQVIRMDMHSGWIALRIDYSKKLACNIMFFYGLHTCPGVWLRAPAIETWTVVLP